jgi:hypothetical protein
VYVDADDARPAPPSNPLPETIFEAEDISNESDCHTDEETYSESESDLDPDLVWRDDIEGFEKKVLHAVGRDRKLAACLIPQLYPSLRKERSVAVGSWSFDSRQCAGDSGSPHQNKSPTQITSGEGSGSNSKKRQSRQDGKIPGLSSLFKPICLRPHKNCFLGSILKCPDSSVVVI